MNQAQTPPSFLPSFTLADSIHAHARNAGASHTAAAAAMMMKVREGKCRRRRRLCNLNRLVFAATLHSFIPSLTQKGGPPPPPLVLSRFLNHLTLCIVI